MSKSVPSKLFRRKTGEPWIDISAIVSAISFVVGLVLANPGPIFNAMPWTAFVPFGAFLLFIVCVVLLQRYMQFELTASTFGKPKHLVTGGVFQYSRNPIYLAFLLPLAALGIYSWIAAAIAIAFYLIVMTYVVIAQEERDLAASFGAEFEAYCTKVPRWIWFF